MKDVQRLCFAFWHLAWRLGRITVGCIYEDRTRQTCAAMKQVKDRE